MGQHREGRLLYVEEGEVLLVEKRLDLLVVDADTVVFVEDAAVRHHEDAGLDEVVQLHGPVVGCCLELFQRQPAVYVDFLPVLEDVEQQVQVLLLV